MAITRRFEVGDLVSEKVPSKTKRVGKILRVYDYNGERRLVVQFEDGSESVFFEFEVITERV